MNVRQYREAQAAIGKEAEEKVAALYRVFNPPTKPLRPKEFADFLGVIVGNANTRALFLPTCSSPSGYVASRAVLVVLPANRRHLQKPSVDFSQRRGTRCLVFFG